jgi:hypothetical protein
MSQAIFSSMLSAAKIEIMAMAENIFNRKLAETNKNIKELQDTVKDLQVQVRLLKRGL